ncbi:A-kinase-interacting protein 1 isoform X2 [Ochotona princeps]|uniref:A-kinase-interacting protein 1 isoform X2 n=1 Tax=Ochotona princeps TaxID=9978 RepID=UPI0027145313|nr:A-kinase-interacting protein 1 isoform X2 [Ochotona princeps]
MGGTGAYGVRACPASATILAVGGGLGLVAGRSGPKPPALRSRVVEAPLSRRCLCVSAQRFMENCLAAAALNGVDRRALQRSARLGREVLERAKRRAVDWPSQERPRGGPGALPQAGTPAACPLHLVQEEREERFPTLSASFRTMAEFMDYTSSQCGGKDRDELALGPGGIRPSPEHTLQASQSAADTSKDLYIEVFPGTYSVTVSSNAFTGKTHVVAVDLGQSVDLVFPV